MKEGLELSASSSRRWLQYFRLTYREIMEQMLLPISFMEMSILLGSFLTTIPSSQILWFHTIISHQKAEMLCRAFTIMMQIITRSGSSATDLATQRLATAIFS